MALYRVTADKLETVQTTSFAQERILERKDLQRLLKADISVIGDDLMVVAEEFGDWEESSRRIDLLCLDKQARLVVIEVKRTDDGGHMELQAIRYAAMVSSMTLDQAVSACAKANPNAQKEIQDFLGLDSIDEAEITGEVRIILVAGNFSPEITASVIWLNTQGLDITCIRLKPYKMGEQVLVDATQIIPLPEAADYEIKIRAQAQEKKKVRGVRQEVFRRFWALFIERSRSQTQLFSNRSATTDHWLSAGIGRSGFGLHASLTEDRARVECYIRLGKGTDDRNSAAFDALKLQREAIEKVFGAPLDWQDLPNASGCRICKDMDGGWKTLEAEWPALADKIIAAMIRLEAALKNPIQALKL